MGSEKSQVPSKPESESESESSQSNTNTHSSDSKKPITPSKSSSSSYSEEDNDLHVKSTPKPTEKDIPTTKSALEPPEESSKKLFQRVFSEEDEVHILKALITFKDQSADSDCNGFVLKSLHDKFTKAQLTDKIRRLKKKFKNTLKSNKKISSPHDKILFDLFKKIWGVDSDHNGAVAVWNSQSKKRKRIEEGNCEGNVNDDVVDAKRKVGEQGVKEALRSEALMRMDEKKRDEIKAMWRDVEIAQLKVDWMRSKARAKENRRILKALGSCD